MAVWNESRYDIGITNVGTGGAGTDITGMMLVRDDKGVPIYSEFDDHYLAQQFFSGGASLVNTPPEKRLVIEQSDFRSGIALEVADPADPFRYRSAQNVDGRHKGQVMAGWGSTAISSTPSNPTITTVNFDFETDTGVGEGWTQGQGTWDRSGDLKKSGSFSWREPSGTNADNLFQDVDIFVPGAEYTFTCWGAANTTGGGEAFRVNIDDGITTTNGSSVVLASTNVFEQATITHTVALNATQLLVEFEITAAVARVWYADVAAITNNHTPVASTSPAYCQAEFNSELYIGLGVQLCKLNAGGTAFDIVAIMPAAITSLVPFQVSGIDYLIIFLGTSDTYFQMTTAEVFAINDLTVKTFQFGAWVNTTVDTMYANDGDNTVRSTVNPLAGGTQWSGVTVVGEAAIPITRMMEKDGALFIDKEDIPFFLDDSGDVQKSLAPDAKSNKSTHSGKNSNLHFGEYYRPAGDQSLLRIGTSNQEIGPGNYGTNLGTYAGQVEAVVGDGAYLYIAIDNGASVEIMAGRDETINGVTSWVWHPLHTLTLTGVETMWISTVFQKRLYVSSTVASESIFSIPLPTTYGNMAADANRFFITDGELETSFYHGGFKSDNKAWTKITATMNHTADSDVYFEAHYQKLEDTLWTDIGDLIATSTNHTPSLFLPVDSDGADPVSTMMKFKFVAKTDTDTTTPIMLDYRIDSILYPPVGTVIYAQVYAADEVTTNQGILDAKSSTIITTIDNARAATWPVIIKDINGVELKVKFLPLPKGTPRLVPLKIEKHRKKEFAYNVLMQVETLS